MSVPPRLRLLLVDDQPLFRKALASLINGQFDMTVVAEASDGLEAVAQMRAHQPDLVVMDVNMPVATGIDGVREARRSGIDTPIVMLTISDEDDDLFEAIKAGANGYLLKNLKPESLFDGIRLAVRGESPISPAIASRLLEAFRHGGVPGALRAPEVGDDGSTLTRRESEILRYVAAGMSNKEIANELTITEGTVKNHVHHALEKLHLTNRVQAAAYAVRHRMGSEGGAGA
ncbi:MAG TPA: response regulator transcription factor [Candidatus Limnocylindrales bacterium]|nr:response regulator transcription factor [Candidatus Limnocylindrales bacterium]